MDFDNDGHLDLISGSYDPGSLHLFRGLGKGEYAAGEVIKDRSDKPVLTKPDQKQPYESYGSWVATVDWDNDGDLDLLIGSYAGGLLVRINEGTRAEPQFAVDNIPLMVGGEPAQIPGAHATPSVVDWDGDGLWDVLSGSENGGVYWLKNVGSAGQPRFDAVSNLIPPHEGHGYDERLEVDGPVRPGIRSQVFATDFNLDGNVDLLLGDFCTNVTLRPDLTADEREALEKLDAELKATGKQLSEAMDNLRNKFDELFPGDQSTSDEGMKKWSDMYREFSESDEYKSMTEKRKLLQEQQHQYFVKPERPGDFNEFATCHGYVWLYLRK